MKFNDLFKAARLRGVSLVGIETPDPASTIRTIAADGNGKVAILQWDCVTGLTAYNKKGQKEYDRLVSQMAAALSITKQEAEQAMAQQTINPTECLSKFVGIEANSDKDSNVAVVRVSRLLEDTVVFLHNANRIMDNDAFTQALWNLRDPFKAVGAMAVVLGSSIRLPLQLQNDIIVLTHPYPEEVELRQIVDNIVGGIDGLKVDEPTLKRAALELRGTSAFAAEQVLAMSIGGKPIIIDLEELEKRKNRQIEETRGLSVMVEKVKTTDVMNCDNALNYLTGIVTGPLNVSCIVLIDEIEKAFAGLGTESSGTTMDALGVLLRTMQDENWKGCIFNGVPGSGKTMSAKAISYEHRIKGINFDLGAMKGGLVGESEANVRAAVGKIKAIAGNGSVFVIATCNKDAMLPPELKRRFAYGTFFYDCTSSKKETDKLWAIYRNKYGVKSEPVGFDYEGWTGAEIRACCETAWAMNQSLAEASKFITPVFKQARNIIEQGRKQAQDGGYISATYAGPYRIPNQADSEGRKIRTE